MARAQLFERSDKRRPVRAHDTRSGFITIALACGRTEAWVQDRTGHKSSNQINGYRRQARTAAELGLGDWTPLDVAIPELGPEAGDGGEAKVRGNVNRGARPIGRRARIAVVSCGSSPPARGASVSPAGTLLV